MQRANNKWNVSEILSLQREYELLELSIDEIAKRHKRSANAIAYKLKQEGFIESLDDARGFQKKTDKRVVNKVEWLDATMPCSRPTGYWKNNPSKNSNDNSSLVSRMAALEVSIEHIMLLLSLSQNTKDNISLNMLCDSADV